MLGGALILVVVSGLFGAAYLLSALLPPSFASPLTVRIVGGAALLGGAALAGWTFRYRSPRVMIVSTYSTLAKALTRTPLAEIGERKERLVMEGPHRYVRNPLYLAVLSVILGWGLVAASTLFLVATAVFTFWFGLVLIPFEEKELAALFGEEWKKYSEATPMLFPFTKRKLQTYGGRPAKR